MRTNGCTKLHDDCNRLNGAYVSSALPHARVVTCKAAARNRNSRASLAVTAALCIARVSSDCVALSEPLFGRSAVAVTKPPHNIACIHQLWPRSLPCRYLIRICANWAAACIACDLPCTAPAQQLVRCLDRRRKAPKHADATAVQPLGSTSRAVHASSSYRMQRAWNGAHARPTTRRHTRARRNQTAHSDAGSRERQIRLLVWPSR